MPPRTESYRHSDAEALLRPEVGVQAQFRKKKKPVTYRYDSSLDPAMSWDEGNAAREEGEALIRQILEADSIEAAKAAAAKLKAMSAPFLNWSGKAEQAEFDVPTLPLFIHERLSTQAIIETLRGHKKGFEQLDLFCRSPAFHRRSGSQGLRTPGQMGQPHDPGRFPGGDELSPALRGHGRTGADDLHGPALRRKIRLQLPALCPQAGRQAQRR